MSEKKHIDRLFQEKFKDFEVFPDEKLWNNIERQLKGKKRRKGFLIPLWYKIAGSAAMLAFLIWAGSSVFDDIPNMDNVKTNIVNETAPAENKTQNPAHESTNVNKGVNGQDKSKPVLTESVVVTKSAQSNDKVPENDPVSGIQQEKTFSKQRALNGKADSNPDTGATDFDLAKNNSEEKISDGANDKFPVGKVSAENISVEKTAQNEGEANKRSLLAYAEQQKKEKDNTFEEKEAGDALSRKWQIGTFAAPVYYSGGNAIDPKFASNPNESDITMAYGVNVAYQVSEKIKVRSGIAQVTISNNIENVAFVSAVEPVALSNVNYNSRAETLRIENASTVNASFSSNGEIQGRGIVPFSAGTLNQQMGYIEVPLEIEYALIDKKFGLSIIGGGSTLFLNQNNISINSAQGATEIGEANNLNKTSFSTNIGLGMDYELSKRFELSLEPIFKYQLNTFSKNVDFNPYYFGVFTGIGFKF